MERHTVAGCQPCEKLEMDDCTKMGCCERYSTYICSLALQYCRRTPCRCLPACATPFAGGTRLSSDLHVRVEQNTFAWAIGDFSY